MNTISASELLSNNLEEAERLLNKAIKSDYTNFWSGEAQILLISVNARKILDHYPRLISEYGVRERFYQNLKSNDPLRRALDNWGKKGHQSLSPRFLRKIREDIVNLPIENNDIPITTSEIECMFQGPIIGNDCTNLSQETIDKYLYPPNTRLQLYYLTYRDRALAGEPSTNDTLRYLQFLKELRFRVDMIFLSYRAKNLMRESETLARLDLQDRMGILDRAYLIEANKKIRSQFAKFPHLEMPDEEIEKLSEEELGFMFRQEYLNYLRSEANLLLNSPIYEYSAFLSNHIALIEKQLDWISNDIMYHEIPQKSSIEKKMFKFLKRMTE